MNAPRLAVAASLVLTACGPRAGADGDDVDAPVSIPFEQYELANGLDVILHVDRSDPIAAVAVTFHVGSAREVEGRTGFAHLFEHLFFLDSENLGPGGLDRLLDRIGATTNGTTNRDRTNYFEVTPIDGLEKILWAEADRMGFFINTVTESVVDKERQVVKNEKRQRVDNAPYGHVNFVVDRALYPDGHPYQWQVIGSLADLDAATLADVVDFHSEWYGPNNATLVVAGDIDVEQTRAWIERYFAEIPSRPTPPVRDPPPVLLEESVRLFHEDNYARLPELTLAWPGAPRYHPDAFPLRVLAALLTDGKSTPLYEVVVEEEGLAPDVFAGNRIGELAGRFTLRVRAYANTDLDRVENAIAAGFERFEEEGVPPQELRRVKAGYEADFYAQLSSVLGKAIQLAEHGIFAGDPGYAQEDLERLLAVTEDDVLRVYAKYLQDRPRVAVSFVPRGSTELTLEGSERAEVVEEPIVQGAEAELTTPERGEERTPSAIDRSVEPPFGDPPELTAPEVWREVLPNGLAVLGIEDREVPLVQFRLRVQGGQLLDDPERVGVANLLAETMTEGTATKTAEELENAIDLLGASIDVSAGSESLVVTGTTLARNYTETVALVEEILLEPRFDPEEVELARQRVANELRQREASPTAIAQDLFRRLLYGDHILAENGLGDLETVEELSIDELRSYHAGRVSPELAALHVTGAVTEEEVVASLAGLSERWRVEAPGLPDPPVWSEERAGLYFVDVPNAAQSVLRVGRLALAEDDPDFYPATVMNFRLGGAFTAELNNTLREQRGYTYGAYSGFEGSTFPGPFEIASSVRSNVTYEALDLVKTIVEGHGVGFDVGDLEATQGYLLRANARAFETAQAKLGMLEDMSAYGFPADYVLRREQVVRDMTVERVRELARSYLDVDRMIWLVVGDARTQLGRLAGLGLGEPVLVDREGERVR